MSTSRPVVLAIMDGFGLSPEVNGNAIKAAKTPHLTELMRCYPFGPLEAAGMAVGVMWGEMGNSEVGHLGIGAGQVVYQNLPRIQLSIEDESFFSNPEFCSAIQKAKELGGAVHLLGLASSGGVHAHIEHLLHLLECCQQQGMDRVYIHMITDGRDTAPQKALEYVAQIREVMKQTGVGAFATIAGRYWSMDRNNNWDRIQSAYDAMTLGKVVVATSAEEAINQSYAKGKFDEEIPPTVIQQNGSAIATIKNTDSLIFFNFREDRARQLTQAFVVADFKEFERAVVLTALTMVTMVEYEKGLPVQVAYPPQLVTTPLGKVIAQHGMKQLRLAESEKYAHVTYFFNGGEEVAFEGESRALIPSKKVESYSTIPEMSAREITDRLVQEFQLGTYSFILLNFANADMVGHTGNFSATVKAVEVVDECIGRIAEVIRAGNGILAITADHGNAEQKIDPTSGNPAKEHTANPVPFIIMDEARKREKSPEELEMILQNPTPVGILGDVAPTLLELMGLPQPSEMTGKSLLPYLV